MNHNYRDILERIKTEPEWYDQNGVPRYGEFKPDMCPDIYARHCGLFIIACQNCGALFNVEMHSDYMSHRLTVPPTKWHYGDPPVHGCTGDTMNCEDLKVLEFWHKDPHDWQLMGEFTSTKME